MTPPSLRPDRTLLAATRTAALPRQRTATVGRLSYFPMRLNAILYAFLILVGCATDAYADAYDDYAAFASANFGAEKEPLIYDKVGHSLRVIPEGSWSHISVYSAAISWETNLPARTRVEYGTTQAYGSFTGWSDRHYYVHLHHLAGLLPQTTYHHRLVSVDERGNTVYSEDRTFTTDSLGAKIRIPQDFPVGTTKFVCDQTGGTYLLTQDITADGRAIEIAAQDITLDLGGRTITYNTAHIPVSDPDDNYWNYINQSANGVWLRPNVRGSKRILNGFIKQGPGNDSANHQGIGFSPIYWSDSAGEIAGVSVEYSGVQISGIYAHYADGSTNIHHNMVTDRGTQLIDRHQGCSAIIGAANMYNNLVRRARHRGIGAGNNTHDNEIHLDSWATNSIGLAVVGDSPNAYRNNRIMGTGYHVVAIGWNLYDTSNVTISDNIVQLVGVAPSGRFLEYDEQTSLNGVRITQYGGESSRYDNWLYEHNLISILVKGSALINGTINACQGRGVQLASDPYISDVVFRDNVVKVVADEADPNITNASCVVTQGLSDRWETANPVVYDGNTFISNFTHVRFGDDYTSGSNHDFRNNRFLKAGNHSRYHTFTGGYWIYPSRGHRLFDNTYEGGAAYDDVVWNGSGVRNYMVGWTLNLTTNPGALVIVKGPDGEIEYFGTADAQGHAYPELNHWLFQPTSANANARISKNPSTIIVRAGGLSATATYSVSGIGESFTLMATTPGSPNQPPAGSILSPADGMSVQLHDEVVLAAAARDSDGAVVKIEFFDNGVLVGERTTLPYSISWTPVDVGDHSLTARFTDDQGAQAVSTPVTMHCSRQVVESRWAFDEGSGTTVGDQIGGMTGTASGPTWVSGVSGTALQFDGIDDVLNLPRDKFSSNQVEVTLAMWVRPNNWGNGGTLFDEISGEYWQFTILDTTWMTRSQLDGETGSRQNLEMPTIPNGEWHHLAFVYSAINGRKDIYLDGALVRSYTGTLGRATVNRTGVTIGEGRESNPFNGAIDEVYFASRALSAAEIQALMNGGGPGDPDVIAPTAPTGLAGTTTSATSIRLTWTASTDNVGVTGYRVYRNGSQVGTTVAPATSYTDNGLTTGTAYSYQVIAVDAAGNASGFSAAAETVAHDETYTAFAAWVVGNFTAAEQANAAISGPDADPERCGFTNFARYAFGLPARGRVTSPVAHAVAGTAGDQHLTLTFPRKGHAPGLQYVVQSSTDLVTWTGLHTVSPGYPKTFTFTDSTAIGSAQRRFLRVRVTGP